MKYLFVFAHPDDETVACAGTIKTLIENKDEVSVLLVTPGDAGEVMEPAKAKLKDLGSVQAVRELELSAVMQHLGVDTYTILNHKDGEITNKTVWGSLLQDIISQINTQKPDVIITFDHTGWYYHLDHVGTSIATTLAYQQSSHRPKALLFSHYQPGGTRWKYIFRASPATHVVNITDVQHKLTAIEAHISQNLDTPKKYLQEQQPPVEYFELVMADDVGKKLFQKNTIFEAINNKLLH